MKTYIAGTTTEIQNPDMSKGYTYPGRIKVGTRDVVMTGSVETYPPNGLRRRENVYEDCLWYREYTEDELAAMHPTDPGPDTAATWEELADAYSKGVSMA